MFIKYVNNIYNINNYYSIIKDPVVQSIKESAIFLMKDESFTSLVFDNIEIRNHILMKIWEELKKNTECFDIDEELKIYLETKKYNL